MIRNSKTAEDQLRNMNKEISREVRKDMKTFKTDSIKRTIEENSEMKVLRKNCRVAKMKFSN